MDEPTAPKVQPPPYAPFATFWTFVEDLAQRGPLPQLIEDSVLGPNLSKAGRWELLSALRFLGLIDKDRRPTADGEVFLKRPDPAALQVILKERYPSVFALGLETATGGQVDAALREMGATDASLNKARRFFIHAAQKGGLELGPHLRAYSVPGRAPNRRRLKGTPKDQTRRVPPPTGNSYTVTLGDAGQITLALDLNLFAIDKETRDDVLALVDKLKELDKPKS